MHSQCIRFYRVCEDYLQQKQIRDDPQARMTTTEVLLTALVAACCFANNLRLARKMLALSGLVPYMLSESRLNRRWHRITNEDWQGILSLLAQQCPEQTYLVDSCPMPVCHNERAKRSRLYPDQNRAYWGYSAAKEEYYYGLKAHVIVTASGRPVEVLLLCGCSADPTGLQEMAIHLPEGSRLIGDKAYTDYDFEEQLLRERQIRLLPIRKGIHKRQHDPELAQSIQRMRKRIETTFSTITAKLPHRLHAVTPAGFESKAMASFVAYAILHALNEKKQTKDG